MFTTETALESLRKFDIDEETLGEWESELGLLVPVDEYGRKQYSPHHINLFKNIKKHLALGRSLEQIKEIISLPPTTSSRPRAVSPVGSSVSTSSKPYASVPSRPTLQKGGLGGSRTDTALVDLVNKLVSEKDQLHKKLMETEKLNSHLYNANTMFHRKVKELTQQITGLKGFIGQVQDKMKEGGQDTQNLKLLDDKAKLQKQLLDAEKDAASKTQELESLQKAFESTQEKVKTLEDRLTNYMNNFDPSVFCGDWVEEGRLMEIVYDNFGINIEPERNRIFRISEKPTRVYGHTAVVTTYYEYETNTLWKRTETLTAVCLNENRLEGELITEFILDGVPVAKANYRVHYLRKR